MGKRGRVAGGLGDAAESELVSKAKKRVNEAMNGDTSLALRIDFLITSGKLGRTKKPEGAAAMLPSCSNKYHLIGKERMVEMLLRLRRQLPKDALLKMDLDALQRLLRFGLRLSEKCAVPTRVWLQLLEEACARYEELGGNRLDKVQFIKKGGGKHVYYEIDYAVCGAYTLVAKAKKFVYLEHLNGSKVRLSPTLDLSYRVEKNDNDLEAVLKSDDHPAEIPVAKLFEKAKLLHFIPTELELVRIGQCSPAKEKEKEPALALLDGNMDEEEEEVPREEEPAALAPLIRPAAKAGSAGARSERGGVPPSQRRPPPRR